MKHINSNERAQLNARSRRFELVSEDMRASWRYVFGAVVARYRGEMLIMLLLGIAAIFAQFAAFGGTIGAIQLMESDGTTTVLGREISVSITPSAIWLGVAMISALLATSACLNFFTGALLARYRRTTFRDLIARTVDALNDERFHSRIADQHPRHLARMLRRECRYLSRAYVEAMSIPRNLLTFAILFVAGLSLYPYEVLILLGVFVVFAPIHLSIARRGERNTDEMVRAAIAKSASDQRIVSEMLNNPFADTGTRQGGGDYASSSFVDDYLERYARRMRMGPMSQLVSSIALVVSLTILAVIWARAYFDGGLSFARIFALVVGFRIAAGAGAQVIQSATVIASYSPLTRSLIRLLDYPFLSGSQSASTGSAAAPASEMGLRAVVFQNSFPTSASAQRIALNMGLGARDFALVHADYSELPENDEELAKFGSIESMLRERWPFLEAERLEEATKLDAAIARGETAQGLEAASIGLRVLIAAAINAFKRPDTPVIMFAQHVMVLTPQERKRFYACLGAERRVVLIYNSVPKKLWVPVKWEVWIVTDKSVRNLGKVSGLDGFRGRLERELSAARDQSATSGAAEPNGAGDDDAEAELL